MDSCSRVVEFNIRAFANSDLPMLIDIFKESCNGNPDYSIEDEISKYTLIAEVKREIVGFIHAALCTTEFMKSEIGKDAFPRAKCYLEIQELYVKKRYRNNGIGSILMRSVLELAKKDGIKNAMVYSGNADYVKIAKYYEKFGFRMWHIFMTQSL